MEFKKSKLTVERIFTDGPGSPCTTNPTAIAGSFKKFYADLATPSDNPKFSKEHKIECENYLKNIDFH